MFWERAAGLPKDMKETLTTISVIALLVLAFGLAGFAAEDSATTTVGWTVNAQQSLSVSSNNTLSSSSSSGDRSVESVYTIPEPDNSDLSRGYIKEKNAVELVAASNVDWEVQVRAESSTLGREGDHVKPVSDLWIRGQGRFRQVGTTPTTIASGDPGKYKIGVDYRVNYDEDEYVAGDYQAQLVYTISVG